MIRIHAHVTGKVQGVGFRWRCTDAAEELGLTGYVKNLFDGRVEIIAEGEEEKINKFLDIIRSFGKPISIKDVNLEKEMISARTYQSFATR